MYLFFSKRNVLWLTMGFWSLRPRRLPAKQRLVCTVPSHPRCRRTKPTRINISVGKFIPSESAGFEFLTLPQINLLTCFPLSAQPVISGKPYFQTHHNIVLLVTYTTPFYLNGFVGQTQLTPYHTPLPIRLQFVPPFHPSVCLWIHRLLLQLR